MDRHIYCNNCGKHGHTYKDCKYPVLSCGNIVFRSDTTEPKILMIQRKDSLCYIDFVRGKYDTYNIPYIQTLLNKCTTDERHRLVTKSYEQLWKELWLVDILDNVNHNEYSKGYDKFTRLKSGFFYYKTKVYISLQYFIDNSDTNYITPEWEFPKGRRNNKESDRDCAIREFREETNYEMPDYSLLSNVIPFTEEFVGENQVRYRYIYYIGYLLNYNRVAEIIDDNNHQKSEISDIKWVTKTEAHQRIRDYHYSRKALINKIFSLIEGMGKDYYMIQI